MTEAEQALAAAAMRASVQGKCLGCGYDSHPHSNMRVDVDVDGLCAWCRRYEERARLGLNA